MKYDEGQLAAIAASSEHDLMVITGGPGTGKTTIAKEIASRAAATGNHVVMFAPTGKAARRIAKLTGFPSHTIHRAFWRNLNEFDVAIIDEASMIGLETAHIFVELAKRTANRKRIILLGDVDQLPPVGPGFILRDIIESGAFPVMRLTELHRQNEHSWIAENARRIREGQPAQLDPNSEDWFFEECASDEISTRINELVTRTIPDKFNISPERDIQVLSPMKKGDAGVDSLNERIRNSLNPAEASALRAQDGNPYRIQTPSGNEFRIGDRIMVIKNLYEQDVFNGECGVLMEIEQHGKQVEINAEIDGREVGFDKKDLKHLTLSYAITVHKSQGSEFPIVVISMDQAHGYFWSRNLLYTAVTRASRAVYLVGEQPVFARALKNMKPVIRHTGLRERLEKAAS